MEKEVRQFSLKRVLILLGLVSVLFIGAIALLGRLAMKDRPTGEDREDAQLIYR